MTVKSKKKLWAAVALLALSYPVAAQVVTADLSFTGAPDMGTYPGYPSTGVYAVSVTNTSAFAVPNGSDTSFFISLSIPTGCRFPEINPATVPAGWTYQRTSLTDAIFWPTADFAGKAIVVLSVPFDILQSFTAQSYVGQIQKLKPTYTDPVTNNDKASGTISVENNPLPVTFGAFSVRQDACAIIAQWTTQTERGNSYFEVERSTNGRNFRTIGKVRAKGNSSSEQRYVFEDAAPVQGVDNMYRIVQYDMDKQSSSTPVKVVKTVTCKRHIEMYPNPTTDRVFVKGLRGKNTVKIFSLLGQEVFTEETDLELFPLNVSSLAAATYQVQVVNDNVIIFNGKFVKDDRN